jgi:tripartite-type tricarboxylate transporter receptor subunit TctC
LTAAAIALCSVVALHAAEWPAKPVRIVSPFAPGGTSDTLARLLAGELGERLGQIFFVENRGGAGGLIGSAAVAAAEPDGGTFLISSIGTHVTSPATSSNPGYDPLHNFTHIAYLGGPPTIIVVHPSLGVTTFQELVARVKRDTVSYISPGPGTIGHLVPELLARKENLKLTHLSYKGAGQAMTDLVAGHVKLGSVTWSSALGQIRAGTVLPLAVSSARPMPDFPGVPTMTALGYPDLAATTWFGFSGPAGLPPEMVARLNAEIVAALATPALRTRLASDGIETEKMSPDEFTRFVASEIDRQVGGGGASGAVAGGGPCKSILFDAWRRARETNPCIPPTLNARIVKRARSRRRSAASANPLRRRRRRASRPWRIVTARTACSRWRRAAAGCSPARASSPRLE